MEVLPSLYQMGHLFEGLIAKSAVERLIAAIRLANAVVGLKSGVVRLGVYDGYWSIEGVGGGGPGGLSIPGP